jgi:BASS family bile acid:Na+ symporter
LRNWAGFETTRLIVPLVQIIMLGMGATLGPQDFARALRMPKAVGLGMLLQFSVMPLTGATLAYLFGFPKTVAAGLILVGSCPGGVASNLMTYLGKGNVALSVTMTTVSTLMAPLMTPLAMQILAGQYVPVEFGAMMMSIINMIVLPVGAGLILNRVLKGRSVWLHRLLPLVSMAGICIIIAIITSHSRDSLLELGLGLVGATLIHNLTGFVLGYWGARLSGLPEIEARTVSIEVGLQNGGMASGLAVNVLRSTDAALAPALFGPIMNVTGSLLASWWGKRPVPDKARAIQDAVGTG